MRTYDASLQLASSVFPVQTKKFDNASCSLSLSLSLSDSLDSLDSLRKTFLTDNVIYFPVSEVGMGLKNRLSGANYLQIKIGTSYTEFKCTLAELSVDCAVSRTEIPCLKRWLAVHFSHGRQYTLNYKSSKGSAASYMIVQVRHINPIISFKGSFMNGASQMALIHHSAANRHQLISPFTQPGGGGGRQKLKQRSHSIQPEFPAGSVACGARKKDLLDVTVAATAPIMTAESLDDADGVHIMIIQATPNVSPTGSLKSVAGEVFAPSPASVWSESSVESGAATKPKLSPQSSLKKSSQLKSDIRKAAAVNTAQSL
jgi:hypothetical protein